MTVRIIDSRQAEADRALSEFEQQGVPTDVARAMLPALVSSNPNVSARARQWLHSNGRIGMDYSDEGQRELRQTVYAARQYVEHAAEAGEFVGEGMFQDARPSDEASLNKALNEQHPVAGSEAAALTLRDTSDSIRADFSNTPLIEDWEV